MKIFKYSILLLIAFLFTGCGTSIFNVEPSKYSKQLNPNLSKVNSKSITIVKSSPKVITFFKSPLKEFKVEKSSFVEKVSYDFFNQYFSDINYLTSVNKTSIISIKSNIQNANIRLSSIFENFMGDVRGNITMNFDIYINGKLVAQKEYNHEYFSDTFISDNNSLETSLSEGLHKATMEIYQRKLLPDLIKLLKKH